jgi:hypothetical protein
VSGTEYLNLNLTFSRQDDTYQAELDCPTGKSITIFNLPYSDKELSDLLARIRQPGPGARAASSTEAQTARDFGTTLFKSVFDKDSLPYLRDSVAQAAQKGFGLRIRISGCPEVVDLPWEYLYDKEQRSTVFASPECLLMRHYSSTISREILPLPIKSTLRVLVMIPGESLSMDAEKEWNLLNEALSSQISQGLVTLERLQPATLSALRKRLDASQKMESVHVFHFIGRMKFDEDNEEPVLMMGDNAGQTEMVGAMLLGNELYYHQPLRLVSLIARNHGDPKLINPFSAAARSLLDQRISAAVTTQIEMSGEVASAFACAFYTTLAKAHPVDEALAEARNTVGARAGFLQSGAPVLYTRVKSGKLFVKEEAARIKPSTARELDEFDELDEHFGMMANAIKEGWVIPFLGAGASLCGRPDNTVWDPAKTDYVPDSRQLASYLVKQLHLQTSPDIEGDLLRASQYISIEMGDKPLYQKLHSIFATPYKPTPLHRLLAEVPHILREKGYAPVNQLVMTTNYDNLMEQAFYDAGVAYDLIYYESKNVDKHFGKLCQRLPDGTVKLIRGGNGHQDISLGQRPVIIKIHGAVHGAAHELADQDSYVITEDDYIDYLTHTEISRLFPSNVASKISDSHFLFLGYSLRDWNLRAILRQIEMSQKLPAKSWAIQRTPKKIDIAMWANHRVEIIDMDLKPYVDRLGQKLRAMPRAGDQ